MSPAAPASFRPAAAEVADRRGRLAELVRRSAPDGLVLVRGAPPATTVFRQSNELYYLTALEVPSAYLTLEARDARATIYLPHRNEALEAADGPRLCAETADEVVEVTGADDVKPLEDLPRDLARRLVRRRAPLLTPFAPAEGRLESRDAVLDARAAALVDPFERNATREGAFLLALHAELTGLKLRDATPFLDELRLVKSETELAVLREAGRLCGEGTLAAMRATAPGATEYELAAAAEAVYLAGGAFGSAYEQIVACGENAWYGHYGAKSSRLQDGQLVLMDAAPDFRYYTSDIGRMWPVSGVWEPWQLELYGFVLRYHRELLAGIRPGVLAQDVLAGAAAAMEAVADETRFSKPEYERAARGALEFPGHLSHPVGMSVHDVGEYRAAPLVPGLVFSVDPMLWVPEERLYVRCEDTVAVTGDGIENLTGFVPLDPDDIVQAMGGSR